MKRNLPTREECFDLLREHSVPAHILRHSIQVNKVALFLAEKLREKGEKIDIELIDRASLLHDLLRIVDIRSINDILFDKDAVITEKQRRKWDELRRKYKGKHHADASYDLLKDKYPEIAELVRKHKYLIIVDAQQKPKTWEEKLVYYADKRVQHDKIVTLTQRLDDGSKRNRHMGRGVPEEILRKARDGGFKLEKEIFDIIKIKPEELEKEMKR